MIQELKLKDLSLDLDNPRFGLSDAADEEEALALLRDRANLRELWDSIAEKGFERYEPLVAYLDHNIGKYIVIEGNRRLAAVKILSDPGLAERLGIRNLPDLSQEHQDTIATLPVTIVANRDDADDYIGFKHINGPASWGSLAKAKFGVMLFEKMPVQQQPRINDLASDTRLQILSRRLGDSRQLLLRTLVGYKVFEQARDAGFLDEELLAKNTLDFSHLYTMLQNPATRKFLGLGERPLNEGDIKDDPIPKAYSENLRHLMDWLFGTEDQPSLIKSQGTDRPKLTKVLASATATETLVSTRDFDRAADEAGFGTERWFSKVITLETSAKGVSDGVSDLPEDTDREELQKSLERLQKARRHIDGASSLIRTFFE